MKGYKITIPDRFDEEGVVVAETRGKAIHVAHTTIKDVGYNIKFTEIRATRLSKFDGIKALEKRCSTMEWAERMLKEHNH